MRTAAAVCWRRPQEELQRALLRGRAGRGPGARPLTLHRRAAVCAVAAATRSPIWPRRLALVAVGGYGRGELHPYSDVDFLVLVPAPLADAERASVEQLVSFLWDIGLEVGHSVRTVAECAEESAADVGVMTTLMESRRLAGSVELVGRCASRSRPIVSGRCASSSKPRCASSRSGASRPTTPPTTSSPTSRPARAGCATSRPSPGWPSATSAPSRSMSWSPTAS